MTGGIATGKSTVAAMLGRRGAVVIDADALAHEVLLPGAPAVEEVVAHFGADVLDGSGAVDRATLGALVFADPTLRADLERITHPRINALLEERITTALQAEARLVVADIPLLFESGRIGSFEATMLVYAPAAVQLQRLRDRDGLDDLSAQRRLAAQLPIDDKLRLATWVIDNGGTRDLTAAQVDTWWRELIAPP
ncbi:MAG: dephospho-CoA kinase [Candidatus Dormibacteria bacterium]